MITEHEFNSARLWVAGLLAFLLACFCLCLCTPNYNHRAPLSLLTFAGTNGLFKNVAMAHRSVHIMNSANVVVMTNRAYLNRRQELIVHTCGGPGHAHTGALDELARMQPDNIQGAPCKDKAETNIVYSLMVCKWPWASTLPTTVLFDETYKGDVFLVMYYECPKTGARWHGDCTEADVFALRGWLQARNALRTKCVRAGWITL